MNVNEIMDRAAFALSVPKCICCGVKLTYGEKAFCPDCFAKFKEFKTRNCSKCAKILSECDCSNEYLESHFIRRVIKCYRYLGSEENSPANALIYSLKRDNRSDVLSKASDELLAALNNSVPDLSQYVITNIPRRKSAIIKYGIDHSELLAKEVSRRCGAKYIRLLESNAKKEQKSLQNDERRRNADFSIVSKSDLTGKSVIIVDDIITSGASMSNAAALIRSMGSKNIIAACLSIAYKDS